MEKSHAFGIEIAGSIGIGGEAIRQGAEDGIDQRESLGFHPRNLRLLQFHGPVAHRPVVRPFDETQDVRTEDETDDHPYKQTQESENQSGAQFLQVVAQGHDAVHRVKVFSNLGHSHRSQ